MNDQATAAAPAKAAKPPKEVQTIEMEDGRKVEFVGKRRLLKDTLIEGDQVSVRLDFVNGKSILWPVPASLLLKCAGHGAEQKLGDETAGYKEDEIDDMILAVEDLVDRLNKGEWKIEREGGGMAGTSILIKALVEVSGKTIERIKEFLKDKSQKEKLALRNSAKLKPVVDRLEAEKAAKVASVDTGALLDELDAA